MEAIRTLGRMPKETKAGPKDEQKLARRLREARRQGKLSAEEETELLAISERQAAESDTSAASPPAAAGMPHCSLMDAIRTLGRLPKGTKRAPREEQQLAHRLRTAEREGQLSADEKEELKVLRCA